MKFLKFKKSISTKKTTNQQEAGERVYRDWAFVIFGFVLIVSAAVYFDGYLLYRINKGDFFEAEATNKISPEILNRKILVDITGYFESRKEEFEAFRSASTTAQIDPSI